MTDFGALFKKFGDYKVVDNNVKVPSYKEWNKKSKGKSKSKKKVGGGIEDLLESSSSSSSKSEIDITFILEKEGGGDFFDKYKDLIREIH